MIEIQKKLVEVTDDVATGAAARQERTDRCLKQFEVAREMGISLSLYSSLETGSRRWSVSRVNSFNEAVKKLGSKLFVYRCNLCGCKVTRSFEKEWYVSLCGKSGKKSRMIRVRE